jgi:hypothetical protein
LVESGQRHHKLSVLSLTLGPFDSAVVGAQIWARREGV